MCNEDYILQMFNLNERIYIDTSTLMEVYGLRSFIEKVRPICREKGHRIIVTDSVCAELEKHIHSLNEFKKSKAAEAMLLVCQNSDIFQIEDISSKRLKEEKFINSFADPELIKEILSNKFNHTQLLITNDRKLSSDVYDLNTFESCRGKRIAVCYLNSTGNLMMCDCARNQTVEDPKIEETKPSIQYVDRIIVREPDGFHKYGIPTLTFAGGLACACGWKPLVKFVKSLL